MTMNLPLAATNPPSRAAPYPLRATSTTRAPSERAISCEPSVLPLSATTTSPSTPALCSPAWARRTHSPTDSASSRQGITTDTSISVSEASLALPGPSPVVVTVDIGRPLAGHGSGIDSKHRAAFRQQVKAKATCDRDDQPEEGDQMPAQAGVVPPEVRRQPDVGSREVEDPASSLEGVVGDLQPVSAKRLDHLRGDQALGLEKKGGKLRYPARRIVPVGDGFAIDPEAGAVDLDAGQLLHDSHVV